MDYTKLFPEILNEAQHFSVFVKMADSEFNKIEDTIMLLDTLSNADRTPNQFIKHLGDLVGFTYVNTYDEEIQRECLKHVWEQKKEIGDKKALTMMATYGDIDGYQGGDLFIPGTYEPRTEAIVILPREYIFSWSKSKWSGVDKYAGDIVYKEGTILIEVTKLNKKIMERVETVKPAGMQIVYKYYDENNKLQYKTYLK